MTDVQLGILMPKASPMDDFEEDLIDYDDETLNQPQAGSFSNQSESPLDTAEIEADDFDDKINKNVLAVATNDTLSVEKIFLADNYDAYNPTSSPNPASENVTDSENLHAVEDLNPLDSRISVSAASNTPLTAEETILQVPFEDATLDTGLEVDDAPQTSDQSEQYDDGTPVVTESNEERSILESPYHSQDIENKEAEEIDADEITWEEPTIATKEQQTEKPEDDLGQSAREPVTLGISAGEIINIQDEDSTAKHLVEGDEIDYNHDASVDDLHQPVVHDLAEDSGATEPDSLEANPAPFPAITVQYKGDEFPLLSLSSQGFFSDAFVLSETLEILLAGFRAELANELTADEELVYQVDELGLEYAESSSRDILCNVTLRQILDIFDLLTKNQDPNSSRTLYTYLFTKPNTSKRFESLVESAAAGVGLDEVSHLFESPMPQTASSRNYLSIDKDLDEMLENYGSDLDEEGTRESEEDEEVIVQQEMMAETINNLTEQMDLRYNGDEVWASETRAHNEHGTDSSTSAASEHNNESGEKLAGNVQSQSQSESIEYQQYDKDSISADHNEDETPMCNVEASGQADEVLNTGFSNDVVETEELEAHISEVDAEEEQDEIDWLGGAQEDAMSPVSSVNPPKRSRPDEDINAEDEKDAKRIRS